MNSSKAPGCYGLPSVHNLRSDTCQNCKLKSSCRRAALSLAQQVHQTVDIQPVVERLQRDNDDPVRTRRPKTAKKPVEKAPKLELKTHLTVPVVSQHWILEALQNSKRVYRGELLGLLSKLRPELSQSTIQSTVSRAVKLLIKTGQLIKANGYYYKGKI